MESADSSRQGEAMRQSGSESPEARDLLIEHALLSEIVVLHPDHLTSEELVVRMEDTPGDTDSIAIRDALQALKRSGLVRFNGLVVEPTYAALRAAAILSP
jgi:hypothetical protein